MPRRTAILKVTTTLFTSTFATAAPAIADEPASPPEIWKEPPVYLWQDEPVMQAEEDGEKKEEKGLPLEAARTIEFETDEATWMSLDVSPDGDTIIFELLGDIYTMPAAGGEATALLTGMAFQSQPVYSPDGSQIAYLSDEDGSENLYVAGADGSEPRKLSSLTKGEFMSPAWSADGDYIYVSQLPNGIGANEIWLYHKHGGTGVQITNSRPNGSQTPRDQQPNAQGVSVSKDGRYLYYAARQGGFEYNMTGFPWSVVRRDLQEGATDTIATAYGGAVRPEISPDGK